MDKENRSWCVYIHTSPSGKVYVGITCQEPAKRWASGYGYRGCPYFMNAIKLYGWGNIKHEIVADGLAEEQAKSLEKHLIESLKANDERYGYNITSGGDGGPGYAHSEESKRKASEKRKAWSEEHPDAVRKTPVCQFDMEGNFIAEYGSALEAGIANDMAGSRIIEVCRGKHYHAKKFVWAYKEDVGDLDEFKETIQQRIKNRWANGRDWSRKAVDLFDKDGNFIGRYESMTALADAIGSTHRTIRNACKSGEVFRGEYRCAFVKEGTTE